MLKVDIDSGHGNRLNTCLEAGALVGTRIDFEFEVSCFSFTHSLAHKGNLFYRGSKLMNEHNIHGKQEGATGTNGVVEAKRFAHNQPKLGKRARELQSFDEVMRRLRIGLSDNVRSQSVTELNQVLADTMMLRDLYKKHHWQVSGITFYEMHQLFDKHYEEQVALIDAIAERIQILGGVAVAMPQDVAEMTRILRPMKGREEVPVQLSRLLEAQETILIESRDFAARASERGDDGTNDLLVSSVIRTNELQVWFLFEHLIEEPLTEVR